MGTAALTHTLTAGTNEDVNDVQENFEDLRDFLNGGNIGPANLEILPAARVRHNANQAIADSTTTVLAFNTETYDTGALHSTAVASGRFTIVTAGIYLVTLHAQFATNGTGIRIVGLRANGTTVIAQDVRTPVASDVTQVNVSTLYSFGAGEYVEAVVFQSSGGALNVVSSPSSSPEFTITFQSRAS